MSRDSESYGEPHILIVHEISEDGWDADLIHPLSCKTEPGSDEWACDVAWHRAQTGLREALKYSGTPIAEPGTYRIQGWSRKTYYHGAGYEHDAGVGVMEPEAAA